MERLIEQLRSLPPWQRFLILLIAPIGLSAYVWFTMLSPLLDERNKLQTDVRNLKGEIERIKASTSPDILEKLRKQEESLNQEYSKKYAELTSIVGEIPTEKDMGKVLENIGSIARKNGIVITGMQMGNVEKVKYQLIEEEGRKIIKELSEQKENQQAQQAQQPQTQQQQVKAPQEKQQTVDFLKSELKLSLLGGYENIRGFMEDLRKRGVISYPHEVNLSGQSSRIKADVSLYLIMKEGGEP